MPILANARHERFAQELAKGSSQVGAYEAAGYEPDTGAASRLSANVSVSARVDELKLAGAERAELDREYVIRRLMRNAERAMVSEPVLDREGTPTGEYKYDGAVANRALELLGKEIGMFVDRSEIKQTISDISDQPAPTAEDWSDKHVTEH